jgi:hypothetical protein
MVVKGNRSSNVDSGVHKVIVMRGEQYKFKR